MLYWQLPKSRDARANRQSQGGENDVQVNLSAGDKVEKCVYIKQKNCQEVFYEVSEVAEEGTAQALFSGSQ